MARAALLVVGIVIGVAHSNPADARKLSGWDLCFSESFPPDRRVATCSAHIRTITHAKASVLLSKAGVYGQKGDYRHAVQDATGPSSWSRRRKRTIPARSPITIWAGTRRRFGTAMPRSRSHQIMRTRYSSVRPRIKERWIIARQSKTLPMCFGSIPIVRMSSLQEALRITVPQISNAPRVTSAEL